ncbi:MAG: AMP-binding protein [Marinicaulis sp.]|nr:AMP-binding protein [Marinicaulis sp.]
MANQNFYAILKAAFRPALKKPFLTLPNGDTVTYGELDERSAQMAGALRAAGAKSGDRVVVQIKKSPANVALYFGALRAGLIYVPLNTAYTDDEVQYFLPDAEPAIFVCDPAREAELTAIAGKQNVSTVLTLGPDGDGSALEAANAAEPYSKVHPRHEDDLAVILYTSGTTGRSKGAMLSHGSLSSNAAALNDIWDFQEDDVLLHALPIFHIHGLFVALHTAMLSACEVLFLPKFDVGEIIRLIHRATVLMGVPTFYTRLLADPEFGGEATAHVRLFISGSAPLTPETFNAFYDRTGHKILERYGMSEAGMITSNPLMGERIPGTVGYPLPGVEIRTDGNPGEPGVVEVRGPNIFKGYWRMPEKTEEEFRDDGFFITGDVGAIADDGRLSLIGREKDLIIAGGYNIYPSEIENVLDAIPGVAESAVIAAPHPDMGEGVVAVLVANGLRLADNLLMDALSPLAKFKRPRKFFWIDALPRNAMGKVQKQVLRETYKDVFL